MISGAISNGVLCDGVFVNICIIKQLLDSFFFF